MQNELERLGKIHDFMYETIDKGDFSGLDRFMLCFLSPSMDISTLKTILVHTKAFRDHETIRETRKLLKKSIEDRIGVLA